MIFILYFYRTVIASVIPDRAQEVQYREDFKPSDEHLDHSGHLQDYREVCVIGHRAHVAAARPESCGNYLLHDLPMCKWECRRYIDRLQNDFHSEYTPLQITLEDGKVFADA